MRAGGTSLFLAESLLVKLLNTVTFRVPHPRRVFAFLRLGRGSSKTISLPDHLGRPFAEDFPALLHTGFDTGCARSRPQAIQSPLTPYAGIFCRQLVCCEYFAAVPPLQLLENNRLLPKR
jgi:hypothetical protein